ncbi:hypothetical protein DPMN_029935 [Dreissena polymorpha]|uniref:Uncharacterized protein n=1 Tax=Dreissena polymorpha TaxID=45954 RepID=A0A9D4LXA7_DREPO|nr:hypothetical protein DPMN_029935 [Dreissena polymorpha]
MAPLPTLGRPWVKHAAWGYASASAAPFLVIIILTLVFFAGNLQKSTVVKHNDCQEHKHAQEQLHRRLYDVQKSPEHDVQVKCSETEMHLFRASYFTAKENLPNRM